MKLIEIAYGRSGDKGNDANIAIIAYEKRGYDLLVKVLSEERVGEYFSHLAPTKVTRYLLPNLLALNFFLENALSPGPGLNLRIDAQGKGLAQELLALSLEESL